MTIKSATLPNGQTVKFGRVRPPVLPVRGVLPLRRYLRAAALPTPPASVDYTTNVPNVVAQMYKNDTLGDCVIANCGHLTGVFTGNASNPAGGLILTDQQIETAYGWCGYVPGNESTDQGCNIVPVLQNWQQQGLPIGTPTDNIAGWVAIDPTNLTEMQTAIWLFENLVFGVELPDAWVNPMPSASGWTWDVTGDPDPNNGHCFPAVGYEANGNLKILTWAMSGFITPAAVAKYAVSSAGGELYAIISQETINTGSQLAPNGLNWAALVADFNDMGGSLSPPAPTPTPVTPPAPPVPTPPTPPTPVPPTPPTPVPPTPPTPPTPPAPSNVGSPQWLHENLPPEAWRTYLMACAHPRNASGIGTPAWLETYLPAAAWEALVDAISSAEGLNLIWSRINYQQR